MRILTLTEPWATMIALGLKRVETRGWSTPYRGPLLIHAGKDKKYTTPAYVAELLGRAGLSDALPVGYEWPYGQIIAVTELLDCVPTEKVGVLSLAERELGDYSPGRFGFLLAEAWRLPQPVAARGMLGLWMPPEGVAAAVVAQRVRVAAATGAPMNGDGSHLPPAQLSPQRAAGLFAEAVVGIGALAGARKLLAAGGAPRNGAHPPILAGTDLTAMRASALDWALECGLKGDIDAEGPERQDYPREGHGWVVILRERAGARRMATARFTSAGRRSMWTIDSKGG